MPIQPHKPLKRTLYRSIAFILSLSLCVFYLSPVDSAQNSKKWGKLDLNDASSYWNVVKHDGTIIASNLLSKQSITLFQGKSEAVNVDGVGSGLSEEGFEIISMVGPVLTIKHHWYSDTGAHPSYGGYFEVINLDKVKHPLSITDLFDEEVILNALLKDRIVQKALNNNQPKTVKELVQMADGGCEMSFFQLPDSFAFHHIKGSEVAVRFGLPHGCEAMRGKFTQIGIYLSIPKAAAGLFKTAEKNQSLMKDLWRSYY